MRARHFFPTRQDSAQGAHLHASPGAETRANVSTPVYADGRIRAPSYRVKLHARPLAGSAIYACLRASPEHHASCQLQGRLPLAATFIPDRDRIPRRWRRRRPDARHGKFSTFCSQLSAADRPLRSRAPLVKINNVPFLPPPMSACRTGLRSPPRVHLLRRFQAFAKPIQADSDIRTFLPYCRSDRRGLPCLS